MAKKLASSVPYMNNNLPKEYSYADQNPTWSSQYLYAPIQKIIREHNFSEKRAFELGCGNGATANMLYTLGFDVIGVDLSESGIKIAKEAYPYSIFYKGNVYDDLSLEHGTFPLVISLEVIEHCYYPRKFALTFYNLLQEGGIGIISTPYHGYLKNLAISIVNKWDGHFSPLWDGGHIKFFSEKTLTALFYETGFKKISFVRAGRFPALAKSMIAVVEK